MTDATTKRLIETYFQIDAQPMMFFTGFFQSPQINFYNSEKVEIDIVRSDEDISIAIQDLSSGYRSNSEDLFTNKEFKAPIHKEEIPLNSSDLLKRMPGRNPFEDFSYRANVIERLFMGMQKVQRKIQRSVELQASQVLQTGTVTLNDSNGNAVYSINYSPKATHFPTAGVSWSTANGTQKLNDVDSLARVVRSNGLTRPDQLIFGVDAFNNFIQTDEILNLFNNRRIERGVIGEPELRGNGGTWHGTISIGNYNFDVWTYDNEYRDPQTGNKVPFMNPEKVIVKASTARLDATFGNIPNIGVELGINSTRIIPELPNRFSSGVNGVDLFTNVWLSPNGEQIFGGVGSRPLMIPTAIDQFGCLTTGL